MRYMLSIFQNYIDHIMHTKIPVILHCQRCCMFINATYIAHKEPSSSQALLKQVKVMAH